MRIESLRHEFAEAVAELEQLRVTLRDFEIRYDARIGILLVELDQIELNIAAYRRRLVMLDQPMHTWQSAEETIAEEFHTDQERINREREEANGAQESVAHLPPPPPPEVSDEIRKLYRRLARAHHPDMAVDEEDRAKREAAMKRINAAMEANDLDELQRLDLELSAEQDELADLTPQSRIAKMLAQIERLEKALVSALSDLAGLKASSLYKLWERTQNDPSALDVLDADIRSKIAERQRELDDLIKTYRDEIGQRIMEREGDNV
ncbi:MAG TPA: DnaJ domain-containing protein [Thermomicrobiaceae bacterium]|nr:DnaJ domain-containing protein [Thermomicrobiaceae bacterium]